MDMMYMPDALKAVRDLLDAEEEQLIHRNAFNITAMSFAPEELVLHLKSKTYSGFFDFGYEVDPIKQAIAESWPESLDDLAARMEWGYVLFTTFLP